MSGEVDLYSLGFIPCEFSAECDICEKDTPEGELFFESTNYEVFGEGNYLCRECAIKKCQETQADEETAVIRYELDQAIKRIAELKVALANVAPDQPINQDEQGGCVWCGGVGTFYSGSGYEDHQPDCAWVAARKMLGGGEVRM